MEKRSRGRSRSKGDHLPAGKKVDGTDVTAAKSLERLSLGSDATFGELVENINTCVAVYRAEDDGKDFILTAFNRAAEETEKIPRNRVIAKRVTEAFPGVVESGLFDVFRQVWRTGIPVKHPVTRYHDRRIIDWREYFVYRLSSGEIVAVYQDLTSQKEEERRLAEEKSIYHSLYAHSDDGVLLSAPDGRIFVASPAACRMLGMSEAQICRAGRQGIVDPASPNLAALLEERDRTGRARGELIFRRGDGTSFEGELTSAVFTDRHGELRNTVIIRDVSARVKAESDLRNSEERYRKLVLACPDGIVLFAADGTVTFASGKTIQMFGETDIDAVIGRPILKWAAPESRERLSANFRNTLQLDGISRNEYLAQRRDGQKFWVESNAVAIRDAQGAPAGIIAVIRDVSERKRIQTALEEERENYRNSLETLPFGIQVVSFNQMLLYINPAMAQMWGYDSLEQLRTVPLSRAFTPESLALLEVIRRRTGTGEPPPAHELTMVCADGSLRDVRVYSQAIVWNGEPCLQLLYEDITVPKKMETEIRNLNEILMLIRNINQLIVRTDDEAELMQKGCEELARSGRYQVACICMVSADASEIKPLAAAGPEIEKLSAMRTAQREISPDCNPLWEAVITSRPVVIHDPLADNRFEAWYRTILRNGFRATISLPLKIENKAVGVLHIYSVGKSFSDMELDLLVELAADISLGMQKIRLRQEQQQAERALASAEVRHRILIDQSRDGIVVLDEEGNVYETNRRFADMIGYPVEETRRLKVFDWEYRWSPEQLRRMLQEIDEKGAFAETRHRRKDGSTYDVEISSNAASFDGQKLIFCVCRDITERKKMEAELKQRAMLLDATTDNILLYDLEGNILYVNESFLRVHNLKREQVHHFESLDRLVLSISDDTSLDYKKRIRVIKEKGEFNHERIKLNPDGSRSYFQIRAQLIHLGARELILSVARDVTSYAEINKRLVESEHRLRILFEDAPDAYCLIDVEGRLMDANRAAEALTGYRREEAIGKSLFEMHLFPENSVIEARKILERSVRGEATGPGELQIIQRDGKIIDTEIRTFPTRIEDRVHILVIVRDITERKRIQENLMVTDRLASIGELSAGLAHELNNPLTSVVGFSDLLLEKQLPDDIRENIQFMNREARRTSEVVKNMLTFARKHPALKQLIDINEVITRVLDVRAYEHSVSNIRVVKRLSADLPAINGDFFQLQQVILNIVINAEYYMKEAHGSGMLTVTSERVDTYVRLAIADDGPGIAPDNLRRIFDPFFTTKPVGKGTGLGLSICYGVISEHNGRLYAESVPGKGATFIIELPVA